MGKRNARFIHNDFEEVNYSNFYLKNFFEEKIALSNENMASFNGNNDIVDELDNQLNSNPEEKKETSNREIEIEEKTKNKRGHGTAMVLLLIVICFSFTFLALDFLSGGFFLKEFDNTLFVSKAYVAEGRYFAIYSGVYKDINIAENAAPLARSRGGAGYIMKNGEEYIMVLAIYENRADAENVIKKQNESGEQAYILELNFPAVTLENMKEAEKIATEKVLGLPSVIYEKLYNLSLAYNGKPKDKELENSLSEIKTDLLLKKENYIKETENRSGANTNILLLIDGMKGIIENIEYGENTVAELRYAYCALINLRMNFVA